MDTDLVIFILTVLLVKLTLVSGSCPADVTISGYDDVTTSGSTSVGTNTGEGYIMEVSYYRIPDTCSCGLLKVWKFYAKASGSIDLQVWRRATNAYYLLVGENKFTVPAGAVDKAIEYTVPPSDRISVRSGDYLGWYTPGTDIIGHTTAGANYPDGIKHAPTTDFSAGATYDWNAASVTIAFNTSYGIEATVGPDTDPGFSNLPNSVIIYQDWTAPTQLFVVSFNDVDKDDVSTVYALYETSPLVFNYSSTSHAITLAESQPTVTATPTTLTFSVYDQCGNSAQSTLDVTVKNLKPTITNLPASATVSEQLTERTLLYTVLVTDDVDTSFTETTSPAASNVRMEQTGTNGFGFYSWQDVTYDYSTEQFLELQTSISDGTDSVTGYFLVYVNKNDPPVFTNLNKGAQATVSYLSTQSGGVVYSVVTTDTEFDNRTLTLTCDPASPCPFTMNSNGVITATSNLMRTYTTGYNMDITLRDPYTAVEPRSLTVLVEDIDDKPVITNLPIAEPIVVYEDTALGTTIITVKYNDLDTSDTVSITAEYNPGNGENYFSLDETTGVLTTATRIIDYEDIPAPQYVLTISVHDGQDSATASLTISIGNVNEAPSFHQSMYTVQPPEAGAAGSTAVASGWYTILDEDTRGDGDTHYFTWDCGDYTKYFVMDRTNGAITYSAAFDLDTSGLPSSTFNCTVTVTDTAGLSGTTYLHVDVVDTNDNSPTFSQTEPYYFFATPGLGPDRFVGQASATDGDYSSLYSTIYYSIDLAPLTDSYVYINEYGNVYVNETWDSSIFTYGSIHVFVAKAQDVDRNSATATISLILAATTTNAPVTTDRPKGFIGDPRNVAWVIPTSFLGALMVVGACLLLLAYTRMPKKFRWLPPWCRKRVLLLAKVTRRLRRQKYRTILRKELEDHQEVAESSTEEDSEPEDLSRKIKKTKIQNINLVQENKPPLPKKTPNPRPSWN